MTTPSWLDDVFAKIKQDRLAQYAEEGALPLRALISELEKLDPSLPVFLELNDLLVIPDGVNSYRGYYSDLAIDYGGSENVLAGDFVKTLKAALYEYFEGYKGGEFFMDDDTTVWVAGYGHASGMRVARLDVVDGAIVVRTQEEVW